MSKTSFVVGMTIAGAVGSSFPGAFKTADRRLEDLAARQEKVSRKLKAAGDVVKVFPARAGMNREVTPATVEELDMADYMRMQKVYEVLLSD